MNSERVCNEFEGWVWVCGTRGRERVGRVASERGRPRGGVKVRCIERIDGVGRCEALILIVVVVNAALRMETASAENDSDIQGARKKNDVSL